MKNKFNKIIAVLLTISLVLTFTACKSDNYTDGNIEKMSLQDADDTLASWVKKINPKTANPEIDLDSSTDFINELPDIDAAFKLSVVGKGQVNIEVWASTERSGDGNDGWINRATENFNKANIKNEAGQTVSVSIRSIDAGAQLDYLTLSNIRPDFWSPANYLWHDMAVSRGINSVLAEERSTGNTAGILMKKSVYDDYMSKHNNKLDLVELIDDVIAGNLVLGFTNPYTSDTALNMLTQMLIAMNPNNPLATETAQKFQDFQKTAPPPAYTTAQMRESAKKGFIDVMVMECQAYSNEPSLADYVFTPFGVRHDNPVYKFSDTPENISEAGQLWIDFITNDEQQKLATGMGFNKNDDYKGSKSLSGEDLYTAQALWKSNKSGGRPTVAVFVCDVSGSMAGDRIKSLKQSLLNSMQYIGEDSEIGLVSYSNKVTIELPIGKFEGAHRGRFQSAVKNLKDGGGTHTNDGVIIALDLIRQHQKASSVDCNYMVFVLSDGQSNGGIKDNITAQLIASYGTPIHTIGYSNEADMNGLRKLASYTEGFTVQVNEDNVIYNMRNMFNSQM